MIFFDTCIWIELCCTTNPTDSAQIVRAQKASNLLATATQSKNQIVTCQEQLVEIISAIQKIKMREYNKICKNNSATGVGNLKDYRLTSDYANTQSLCIQAVTDVCKMAVQNSLGTYNINSLLSNIHLVDVNDYLYYQYCITNNIDFYTFDGDFSNLASSPMIHII